MILVEYARDIIIHNCIGPDSTEAILTYLLKPDILEVPISIFSNLVKSIF